jgi:myo-inositol-1(or 4)-monophosphatase
MRVSEVDRTNQAILATGLPANRDYAADALAEFGRSLTRWHKVRMLGSAALSLAYVGAGRIDCYREESIMTWDVAAGWAIVCAAGGIVRARPGAKASSWDLVAGNSRLIENAFGP